MLKIQRGSVFGPQTNTAALVMNAAQGASVINNFYTGVSDSSIRDSIKQFEEKLRLNADSIELTRKDIQLLTLALKEIEQRTSGMEKLPDGRTKLGGFVTGSPIVVIRNMELARSNLFSTNFSAGYFHATNAIAAFERSPNGSYNTGEVLTEKGIGILYARGATLANLLKDYESVVKFGTNVLEKIDSVESRLLVIDAMARLSRTNDTLTQLTNAIVRFPNDTRPPFYRDCYVAYFSGEVPLEAIAPKFE